jgi:hypothetical protein
VGECRGRRITVHKQPQPFGQVICLRPRMDEVVEWEVYGGTPPVNVIEDAITETTTTHRQPTYQSRYNIQRAKAPPHVCLKGQEPDSLLYYRTYCGYRNHD